MLTSVRSFAKKNAPDWLVPTLQRGYLRAQQTYGQVQHLADTVALEVNYRGQTPRVFFPTSFARTHPGWQTYLTYPPVHFVPYRRAELCHWINTVPEDPAKPCIAECEHILALAGNITDWQWGLQRIDQINDLVAQENCRFVFTYSEGLVRHSRRYLRPELWHKLGAVYQIFPAQPVLPKPPDRPFIILCVASRFSDKGVPEALAAYRVLRERYGGRVQFVLVCQAIPRGYQLPAGIIHHDVPRMNASFKESVYRSADVLFIPAYSETAGCFYEATAFGVPVVTTRIHHDDEFVKPGVTGFLIDAPIYSYSEAYGSRWRTWQEFVADIDRMRARGELQTVVDQSVAVLDKMIAGQVDLAAMSRAAIAFHAERFDPEVRNRRLRELYQQALDERL